MYIRCIEDIERTLDPDLPVVSLFSGGLDSSHLLKLLQDFGSRSVVALAVNVGDNLDTELLATRAASLGAEFMVVDARAQFAREFVIPAIQAQAYYQGIYPISSSLSRPLIARIAMSVAQQRGANAILHSAHPTQNTLRRINGSLELLGFTSIFGSPYDLTPVSRSAKAAELAKAGVVGFAERTVSIDSNLWCREFESGVIGDPERFVIPDHLYTWTRPVLSAERTAVEIGYERGVPTARNGRDLNPVELIGELNQLAGRYRIGRYVGLEHLATGDKVLEVREMPAAHLLLTGYAHLLSASVDAETIREKKHLDLLWVREAVEGRWFGRLRAAAQQFFFSVSDEVNGTIEFELVEGYATPISIRSSAPLYIRDREGWEHQRSRRV